MKINQPVMYRGKEYIYMGQESDGTAIIQLPVMEIETDYKSSQYVPLKDLTECGYEYVVTRDNMLDPLTGYLNIKMLEVMGLLEGYQLYVGRGDLTFDLQINGARHGPVTVRVAALVDYSEVTLDKFKKDVNDLLNM